MSIEDAKRLLENTVSAARGTSANVNPDSVYLDIPTPDGEGSVQLLAIVRKVDANQRIFEDYKQTGEPIPLWLKEVMRRNCLREGIPLPPELA